MTRTRAQRMRKPTSIDPLADRTLQGLAAVPEATEIVLGGYLALQHHVRAYRQTHDIDAWWRTRALPEAEKAFAAVMRGIASEVGSELRERRFGETLSLELVRNGKKHFSFQIAVRSVQLEPPITSPWAPILIETLADTVGSKMNALVERGSPRDFLDIRMVEASGQLTANACWDLWAKKNRGQSVPAAKQKALLHLMALETRRPLEAITDAIEREQARQLRTWFRQELLKS